MLVEVSSFEISPIEVKPIKVELKFVKATSKLLFGPLVSCDTFVVEEKNEHMCKHVHESSIHSYELSLSENIITNNVIQCFSTSFCLETLLVSYFNVWRHP